LRQGGQVEPEVDDPPGRPGGVQEVERVGAGREGQAQLVGLVADYGDIGVGEQPVAVRRFHMESQLSPARRCPQRGDVALEHRAPTVDHGDVLAEILHEVELVAGEQHNAAAAGPLLQGPGQAGYGHRVQAAERLVEHDDRGVVHQGRGQLEALLHAAGEPVGAVSPPVVQAQLLEQPAGSPRRVPTGQPVQPPEVDDLVTGRHPGVEPTFLRHVPPATAGLLADGTAVVAHLAAVGVEHPEHDAQQRRLAGTVRAEQAREHPRRDVEAHSVEGHSVAEGACDVENLKPHGSTLSMVNRLALTSVWGMTRT
jgi:hypothetical protein